MNMKKKISNIHNIFPLFSIKYLVLIYGGILISSCSNGANDIKHREYFDKCKGGKKIDGSVLEFTSSKDDTQYMSTTCPTYDTEYVEYITQNLYQDKKKLLSDIIANILYYNGENLVSHIKTVKAGEETYLSLKGDKEKLLSVTINDNGDSEWKLNITSRNEYGYNDYLSTQLQKLFNSITFENYDENLKAINDILYEKLHNLQSFNGLDYKDVKSFFKKNFGNNFVFERIDTNLCGNSVRKYKCFFLGLIKYSIEVEFFFKEGNDNKPKLCYRFTSYDQNISIFKYRYWNDRCWDDIDFDIPLRYVMDQRVIYRANEILNKIFHNLVYDKGYFKNENHYVNSNDSSHQIFELNSHLTFIPNLSSKSEILRVTLNDKELNIILNDEVLFRYNIQPFSEEFDVDTIVDQFRETNEYRKITEFFTQIPRINLNKSRTKYNTFFS